MRYSFGLFFAFALFYITKGGPVKRSVPATVPLNNLQENANRDTQIGTEQGVVSVAPNNVNTNNIHVGPDPNNQPASTFSANTGPTTPAATDATPEQQTAAPLATPLDSKQRPVTAAGGEKPDTVDAKLDEDKDVANPVTGAGELEHTVQHASGETEAIYNGTPEQVLSNKEKGLKQPVQTIVKSNGEVEKVYDGKPSHGNQTEQYGQKEATATLAQDTFNISIPLKPRNPPVIKFIGNETGVIVKSPASENFKFSCIREHNKKRFIHNSHALVWSDKLAESAQIWADHLADIDDDIKDVTNMKYGENVFWTRPQLPEDELCKAAVDEWYNEVKLYDFAASHKRHYDADSVNEFTQLVYDGQTREVGVAYSLSRTNKQYVVARYYKKKINRMLDTEVHPPHSDSARVRFDRPVFQTYNMIISLPKTSWLPQYKQTDSPAYQRLESKMKNAFKATFQESPSITTLADFKLNDFKLDDRKKGSAAILADVDLKFYPHINDPIQRLRSSVFNGQLNGMDLDDKFLKVFNTTGVYEPPSSWRSKMADTEMQADIATGATDPITGQPTNLTYPLPISADIDLLDRKPCQGGTCETYLIKDPVVPLNGSSPNIPGLPPGAGALPPGAPGAAGAGGQPCCNQMPPPQPCLALACPPPPSCNPGCPPAGGQGGMGTPGQGGMGQAGMGHPGMGQAGMGHPGMGQGMGRPGMGQTGMGHPGMGYPGMGQPGMGYPGMGHPGMGQQGMGQQGMGQAGTKQAGTGQAGAAGQAGAGQPGATSPGTTPPGTTPPGTTPPGTTPPGTAPSGTAPSGATPPGATPTGM